MSFINKKEEVIDLKLTRFGRGQLSRGRFEPMYYQFFDDDIIYDLSWTGAPETQNEAEPRIKAAARTKTQHLAVGIETSFDQQTRLIERKQRGRYLDLDMTIDQTEEEKILKYPLGTQSPGTQIAPSFFVDFLDTQITGAIQYATSSGVISKIPSLNLEPTYTYTVDRPDQPNLDIVIDPEAFVDFGSELVEFFDGSMISLNKKDIVIDVEEYSSFSGKENFEVEFYKETFTGSDKYIRMKSREEIEKFFTISVDNKVDKNINSRT
mgnify:CR=1 FL=1|tara:strand:+ start:619 stop:1416 length:798 start_codon:yes stop_codon:yes gene_type:complete